MRPDRREILRRLGSRRFRFRCACGQYVDKLVTAHVWPAQDGGQMRRVQLCTSCAERVEAQNRERLKERMKQRHDLQAANIEHQFASQRSSSYEYLAACARMRREMGIG